MPVTMLDIAKETGLSRRTVGLALGPSAHLLRPETCSRIQAACRKMGYRPNSSALAMKTGRFNCIGLLQSTGRARSYMPDGLAEGIHDRLLEDDLQLAVARLPDERLTDAHFVPRILRQWTCDGLLIDYINDIPPRLEELIAHHHIPSIWINAKRTVDCVYPDDFAAARTATQEFLQRGHRRIAYLRCARGYSTLGRHYSELDRRDGYLAAMQSAQLPAHVAGDDRAIPVAELHRFTRALLTAPDRPTAWVVYSDHEAAALLTAGLSLGFVQPPPTIAFAGAPIEIGGLAVPTMRIPERELGRRAVSLLLEKICAPTLPLAPLPLSLVLDPAAAQALDASLPPPANPG
ncbi:MAG: LacI family DNA-binding transcriptional regulator [Planctomycetota bacterium]